MTEREAIEAIRSIVGELLTPSNDQTPYVRGVIAVAHAILGAALIAPFGVAGAFAAGILGGAYWLIKERGDLARGGAWRDGLEDALFVSMGAFYGFAWWPILVLSFSGLIMIIAEAKKQ